MQALMCLPGQLSDRVTRRRHKSTKGNTAFQTAIKRRISLPFRLPSAISLQECSNAPFPTEHEEYDHTHRKMCTIHAMEGMENAMASMQHT